MTNLNPCTEKKGRDFHFFYFFSAWVVLLGIVFLLYKSFWDMIAQMDGFFYPSIYTTLFCLITLTSFFISSAVSFILSRKSIWLAVSNFTILIVFFVILISLTNTFSYYFEYPSIALRERFSSYSYLSVTALAIIVTLWLIRYWRLLLVVKVPIWACVLFGIMTTLLFVGWWLFIDIVTSM